MKIYVKSSMDTDEIYDIAAIRRVSNVIKNISKYKSRINSIAKDVITDYLDNDVIFYDDLRDDIYHDLRKFVCSIAKVDYNQYDLGEDNYDDLVGIAGQLAQEFADKYNIDLIGD